MKLLFPFRALLMSLTLTGNAFALLKWDTTQVTQKAEPMAESVSAAFRFENIGSETVTIKEIKSSCGCTTAALDQKTYAPGESGEIVAKFNIGSRQGLETKTVTVMTDEGDSPTVLTMKTLIPKILEMQPAFVFWQKDEIPEPKTINLKVGLDAPVKIVSAKSDNSNMSVQLDVVEEGKAYRLTVFPATTDDLLKARITLVTDFPADKPKTYFVFAHVK